MKIGQYCQRQRCRHVELEQFWQAFASRGFVSDSWAFLFCLLFKQQIHICIYVYLLFALSDFSFVDFPSVLWYCWLGLLTCKTVSHITYTVLVGMYNTAQSNPVTGTRVSCHHEDCYSTYQYTFLHNAKMCCNRLITLFKSRHWQETTESVAACNSNECEVESVVTVSCSFWWRVRSLARSDGLCCGVDSPGKQGVTVCVVVSTFQPWLWAATHTAVTLSLDITVLQYRFSNSTNSTQWMNMSPRQNKNGNLTTSTVKCYKLINCVYACTSL